MHPQSEVDAIARYVKWMHIEHATPLAIILSFIGVKMMISGFYHVPIHLALLFVLFILIASVVLSLIFPKKEESIEAI